MAVNVGVAYSTTTIEIEAKEEEATTRATKG